MYETIDSTTRANVALPAEMLAKFNELSSRIAARSLIVWGEHCSECSYPTCYTSCAFYTPRRDGHCRRFANGIEQAVIGEVTLGRIKFRKWPKLEGTGSIKLFPVRTARFRERLDRLASSLINKLVPSRALYARFARHWNRWKAGSSVGSRPERIDAFIVEAWLESGPPLPLTVTIVDDSEHGLLQSGFDLQVGYNRLELPHAEIAARLDLHNPFRVQIEPVGDATGREVTFGVIDFVRFMPQRRQWSPATAGSDTTTLGKETKSARKARTAKCVVWDLDDTIWRGTLAEDGHESLALDPIALATIIELDRRGILQSVATKNDPDAALAALAALKIRDYFLFPQTGWGPKSVSIKRIAELLDIGLDTLVFIDDQPFERGEVGETLPEVTVLPASDIPTLLTSPLFDVPATPESAKRRAMYQTEELRHATFTGSVIDYVTFLRQCRIRLEISELTTNHQERAYELSQRTNQLNVSGTKYSRDDIKMLMQPSSPQQAYMLRCQDRFGDYGVIGMCVVDRRSARVHSFMMSCRVQRKRVEQSFFAWLSKQLNAEHSAAAIVVDYRKTPRNGAVVKMLDELGFAYQQETADAGTFVRPSGVPIAEDDVVEIVDLTVTRELSA
jgi:FkbH-like protein